MHFTNLDASRAVRQVSLGALVFLPLVVAPAAGDPYQPARALVAACAVAAVLLSAPVREPVRVGRAVVVSLVVLLVATFASALLASPASSVFGVHGRFQGLLTTLLFAAAAVAGARGSVRAREMRFVARAAALSLGVQSALVIGQRISGSDAVGMMGNSVLAAGWLVAVSAFVAGAAVGQRGRWRTLSFAAAALGMVALGATGTRGAWVSALVAGGVLALLARGRTRVVAAAALAALIAGALLLGGPAVLVKLAPGDIATGSAGSRVEIWKATAAMVADRPLLGVGPGRFVYEYPAYQTAAHVRIEGGDTRADQAHGVLFQTAAESGMGAALALAALVGLALAAGVRGARRGDAVSLAGTMALAAFATQALFGISTVETDTLAWFLGGILVARGVTGDARNGADRVGSLRRPDARWPARAGAAAALVCAAAAGAYLLADVTYSRSVADFESGRFADAMEEAESAIALNPLTDVYRVALADAAGYAALTGDTTAAGRALIAVEVGLDLEPDSYDLAASRVRLLVRSPGAAADEVWKAYRTAFALYPRGIAIRREALDWADVAAPPAIADEARVEFDRVTADAAVRDADE